ncbi:hypothetical protein [Streptomyces sp. SP18BB07]|uniref:hypothetical protein n=1 Tax=Streptomyces sp. SP18BB07 TaxID=3002522 RepID=UPI002E78A08E|nr:hypothetical protein [Streptomyces sp. SP18BB07]MEE1764573.1 hypothetical protein [Streptomyces sp. SP18BB07]
MQKLAGLDEPDFRHLLDDTLHEDGTTARAARYCAAPRMRPEILFRLSRPLHVQGITVRDVFGATEAVPPALETLNSRIRDWKITLPDTIADHTNSARLVHGSWTPQSEVRNPPRSPPTSFWPEATTVTGIGGRDRRPGPVAGTGGRWADARGRRSGVPGDGMGRGGGASKLPPRKPSSPHPRRGHRMTHRTPTHPALR